MFLIVWFNDKKYEFHFHIPHFILQGDRGAQISAASMGMGMGGMGGGDFPTAIIEGPPGPPGSKGKYHCYKINM